MKSRTGRVSDETASIKRRELRADAEQRKVSSAHPAIMAFVDELAALAADLWFDGKLDGFPTEEDGEDADEQ